MWICSVTRQEVTDMKNYVWNKPNLLMSMYDFDTDITYLISYLGAEQFRWVLSKKLDDEYQVVGSGDFDEMIDSLRLTPQDVAAVEGLVGPGLRQ